MFDTSIKVICWYYEDTPRFWVEFRDARGDRKYTKNVTLASIDRLFNVLNFNVVKVYSVFDEINSYQTFDFNRAELR